MAERSRLQNRSSSGPETSSFLAHRPATRSADTRSDGTRSPTALPTTRHEFSRIPVQAKLTISQPQDPYEQEADHIAHQVLHMPEPSSAIARKSNPSIDRQCANCDKEEKRIQPKFTQRSRNDSVQAQGDLENQLSRRQGGGSPLPETVRSFMEPRFQADFSQVRVHRDRTAAQLNRELNAHAFTYKQDLYFGAGKSPGNNALTAHELAHVVQQVPQVAGMQPQASVPNQIQRGIGDGHDLSSPRFARDVTLQDIFDGTGTLKRGDTNDSVRRVQHALHDTGILLLRFGVDGIFGPETERAVTRFQTQHHIATDPRGEVGAATIAELDRLFPAIALPATAGDPYTFAGMLAILCQWNAALIRDLRNLRVEMVARLEWADEQFDGTNWVPHPMPGAGETSGRSIIIATDNSNQEVAKALYHEYQHARSPASYARRSWGDEETRAFTLETQWAIDRGISPDPSLTTTDPVTGDVVVDPTGVAGTVGTYPGVGTANPGEVIAKVGANRVRVRLPNGRIIVRNAVAGDTVPGPRQITPPRNVVPDRDWHC